MKISKLTSVILAAMMTATAVPFNEVTVPYNNFASYAVEAEEEVSYEQEIVAEGTCGENLTWTIYDDEKVLVISGEGAMTNWENSDATPWAEFNDYIEAVRIDESVTEISENSFDALSKLDTFLFYNHDCIIPDNDTAIPANAWVIGYTGSTAQAYAEKYGREFEAWTDTDNNEGTDSVSGTFENSVEWVLQNDGILFFIGEGDIPNFDGNNPWGENADSIKDVAIDPSFTTAVGDYAFYNCKNLISTSITSIIGAHAYEGCSNLTGLGYGENLQINEICDYAFYGCDNLGDIEITNPECVIADSPNVFPEHTIIYGIAGSTAQAYAEKYGRGFVDIENEESDEQEIVAEGVCGENLTWELDDNGSLLISGEGDMYNWASAEDRPWAEYTSMIRTVSMSEEVTSIGDYAFYGCENLVTGALTSVIGAHAYEGCKRMVGYSYYSDVSPINEIKDCAFKGCYTLWAIPIANPDCIIADSEDIFDNNTTIMGYADSTAQEYAEKYERDFQDITLYKSEGSCGESLYWYTTSDGMLGITGSGEMQDYSEDITATPWYSLTESITSICINDFNFEDEAIALSENCFAMCENVEKIYFHASECIIADSAETIPENAVIWGYAGSTAQEYAEKYNRKFETIPTTDASGILNDEYTWELSSEGILYITGFDAMDDYTDVNPWGEYADKITGVYFYGNVTSIGKNAFSYCKNLEFVDIDESIEFIDEDAFSGCDKLEFINFHGNKKCVINDSDSTIPAQTELIGHFGSPVHEYADKYERTFCWIDGDINEDSSVDAGDASMVLAEYSNIQTGGEAELSSVETTTADVTNDNVIDASDASAILQYYAKTLTGQKPTWD